MGHALTDGLLRFLAHTESPAGREGTPPSLVSSINGPLTLACSR